MGYFIGIQANTSDQFTFVYTNITPQDLSNAIDQVMQSIGYKHLGMGVYEKGSRLKRILFGAFVKYFKMRIAIDTTDPNNLKITVFKNSTGLSGGVIGMNQAKTEMEYLRKLFQAM